MGMANPNDFPRRILLAVTGLTTQVVTETLYALAVARKTPWVPTQIRLVTTQEGAHRARLELLDPREGRFHALCREYGIAGIRFTEDDIVPIRGDAGRPLADIRTPEDNTLAADCLLGEVRALCADADCALHVSIAGGRKTMGFFLGYALSFFGRPQDRLSHVLVNEPFESLKTFFYPPRQPTVLHDREGRPAHTSEARVMLAEIPFVRLREGLPREALAHPTPFATLVASAQEALEAPALAFDFRGREVYCGSRRLRLTPALFAWYAFLAECRMKGAGEEGFVRDRDVGAEPYLALYARLVGRHDPVLDRARQAYKAGLEENLFQRNRTKINQALKKALGLAAAPYCIEVRGSRPHCRYGLALPPERIRFAPPA